MINHMRLNRKRSAGFGLVEIMVALVIGMFGVMVMMQVLSLSEEQKRTTTGSNDAMNEGVLALYTLQGDIRMSGYDIADTKLLGCSLTLRAGVTLSSLAPVTVNSSAVLAGDANTDTLLVFYGMSDGTPQGDTVLGSSSQVQTPSAFAVNDWVVVAPQTRPPCSLTLSQVKAVDVNTLAVTLKDAQGVTQTPAKGDRVFNLGQTFRVIGYAVRNSNLTMCDYTDATTDCTVAGKWTSIASNIVSLRAQYGRDTAATGMMDAAVDVYDQATPSIAFLPDISCGWARISALRLALVARSAQMEKTAVTPNTPVWDGSAASSIDLTGNASWQNYRYKVFQTTVPIRNISWMKAPVPPFVTTAGGLSC